MKRLALAFCCVLWAVTCYAQTALRPDQISPATPDITWAPGGTGYQIGSTIPWRTDSTATSTPPDFTAADNAKTVELTFAGAITKTLPDATGAGLASGFGFSIQTGSGTLTLNRLSTTSQLINGQSSIKVGAYQLVALSSRGGNWYATFSLPQPPAQTGATVLADNMTWQTGGSAPAPCTAYTNWYTRVGALSGPPVLDTAHQTAMQTMICDLVTNGVWATLDFLYIFATNTTSGSATAVAGLNLKSNSFPITVHGSPTFTPDAGYTGVAGSTTVWLDTGFNPATAGGQYTLNSAQISLWSFTNTMQSGNVPIGIATATDVTQMVPWYTGNIMYCWVNQPSGSSTSGTSASSSGLSTCSRTSSAAAGLTMYENGSVVASNLTTGGSSAIPSLSMPILAQNNAGTVGSGTAYLVPMAAAGSGLSSGQVSTLYTTVCTYLTAVHTSC
jgi:hypothetical protein